MKKIKQGQTKWQVVHYEPYSLEDQGDYWVTFVHACCIEYVKNGMVHFVREGNQHVCLESYWKRNMHTYRKACRLAEQEHYKLYEQTEVTE